MQCRNDGSVRRNARKAYQRAVFLLIFAKCGRDLAACSQGQRCAFLPTRFTNQDGSAAAWIGQSVGIFGHVLTLRYDRLGPDKSSFALIIAWAMSSIVVRLYIACSLINL